MVGRSSFYMCIFFAVLWAFYTVNGVEGRHHARKAALRRKHAEAEWEEELDAEAEEEENDLESQYELHQHANDYAKHKRQIGGNFQKDSIFEQGESRDFLQFLRRINYDHRQTPQNFLDKPVNISVSVVISNVRAVSEVTMDYSLEMFYRETWLDRRLQYDPKIFKNKSVLALHESYSNFLWHPDTFMPNAIASKNPRKQSISHRSLLRLQSNGDVLYSRRISIVAECPMDLTLFPFDSQTCKLGIESYGYTSDQVRYGWSDDHQREALRLYKIRLPDFKIKEAFVTSQLEAYATGNYSRLYVCFVFSRSAGFCFLQLIIPSTAVVITSWVSLWMENETSFQDMISIILTITFLLFSYNEVMPRVSYLKALDIWLAVCFMIVFLSLIKLAIMKYMRQRLKMVNDPSISNFFINPLGDGRGQANGMWHGQYGQFYNLAYAANSSPLPRARSPRPSHDYCTRRKRTNRGERRSKDHRQRLSPTPVADQQNAVQQNGPKRSNEDQQQQRPTTSSSAAPKSAISAGLGMAYGNALGPIIKHHAVSSSASPPQENRGLGGGGGGAVSRHSYQPSISTLAAASLNLPLSQSSLRQLQNQHFQQEAHMLQLQLQRAQLLQQTQRIAWEREKIRERKRRRKQKRMQEIELDANKNEVATSERAKGLLKSSPIEAIRIRIETSSSSSGDEDNDEAEEGHKKHEDKLFCCFDQFGNVEFSVMFARRFHWISQMTFFFGFVLFCLYFFIIYPNSRTISQDPACLRENAEWFASIPT